jgi:thioredoxin-like negative regulator of GroEL
MAVDATVESFHDLVQQGNVLVDFWGPQCAPCLALMPHVDEMEGRYGGSLRVVKVNAPENRKICRDLRVIGLPTYVLYRSGDEVERLSGDPSLVDIERAVARTLARTLEGGD